MMGLENQLTSAKSRPFNFRMALNQISFTEVSTDTDNYVICFVVNDTRPMTLYAVLTESVQVRISQIIDENELRVLGFSLKVDCFEFSGLTHGFIEIDSLFHSESVSSLDAYLYDTLNVLKAKASCTVQYEKENRVPAY